MKQLSTFLKENLTKEEYEEFKSLKVNDNFLNLLCKSIEGWIVEQYSPALQDWIINEVLSNVSLNVNDTTIDE